MNRFRGTNIDTLRANHPFLRDQPAPDGQGQPRLDSVGPPFTPPPRVYDEFLTAMERRDPPNVTPMGMKNLGNQCYRNAVLTMLINSDVFIAYARWHLDNEPQYSIMAALRGSSVLRTLVQMASINESQKSLDVKQAELYGKVADFWRAAAFPQDPTDISHKMTWPPEGPWGALEGVDNYAQEDAGEFLIWLLGTIDGQLAHHHNSKDMRTSKKTSAQQDFDWLSMLNTATRIDCPQCTWRVHQRGRVARERPLVVSVSDMDEQSQSLSLQDCISRAFRYPLDEAWCCDRCKRRNTKGHKLLTIQHAPNLLMIALNRTAMEVIYHNDGTVRNHKKYKHLRAVVIPEALDVSPWLNHHQFGLGSKVSYRLAGVVSHRGETMDAGHYQSYVRGGQARDKWFRLNDDIVTLLASTSVFDDSNATDPNDPRFARRFTPVNLIYERDTANEVIVPGYHTINVNEGEAKDVRPKRWTGPDMVDIVVDPSMPAPVVPVVPEVPQVPQVPNFDHFNVAGSSADQDMPGASVDVTIKIGDDIEMQFPRCYIDSLDRKKRRKIEIEAKVSATKSELKKVTASDDVKEVHLDLMDAWFEAELEKRERAKEQEMSAREARGKGKKDDDVEKYVDKKLKTWDRKRKRTPWPSRWIADSESDDDAAAPTRKQPQRQVKKPRGSGRR